MGFIAYVIFSTIVHILAIYHLFETKYKLDESKRLVKHLKIQVNELELNNQQLQLKLDKTESRNLFVLNEQKVKSLK